MSGFDGKKVVVLAAITFGLLQVGLAGVAHVSRTSLGEQIESERKRLEVLEVELEEAQATEGPVQPEAAAPSWRLLDGPDVVGTLQQLQTMGDELGLTFEGQTAVRSAEQGKQSFVVAGHGTANQVVAFLAEIEQSRRLMIVETGRMTPAGGDQIAFEFGLATYHGEEQR